ncbi:MAG: C40 family peptidase [Clostridia bacterium]|nr:C40 family peptidase [Clostridia bacterium]
MSLFKKTLCLLLALAFTLAPLQGCAKDVLETPPTFPPQTSSPETDEPETSAPAPAPDPTPKPEPEPEPEPIILYDDYIRCTGSNINIRAGAGTSYSVLGTAEKGTVYAVTGKSGNWYQTKYRNKTAYIYASYTVVLSLQKSDNEAIENVIAEGYKLLGVPYVYGAVRLHDGKGNFLSGFTAQKFDCSSLIQYVFYKGAGKLLQVNTRTQVKQGKYVKASEIQRGDCLFFTNAERQHLTGVERVGHVALYLGNNYILHTSSDYARIEKMSAARWSYYIEARRFL